MNKLKLFFSILCAALGVFIFVYGGYDDSPGAQLLGLIVIVLGILGIRKNKKKISN